MKDYTGQGQTAEEFLSKVQKELDSSVDDKKIEAKNESPNIYFHKVDLKDVFSIANCDEYELKSINKTVHDGVKTIFDIAMTLHHQMMSQKIICSDPKSHIEFLMKTSLEAYNKKFE